MITTAKKIATDIAGAAQTLRLQLRSARRKPRLAMVLLLLCATFSHARALDEGAAGPDTPAAGKAEMTLGTFLDRLMMAESGGQLTARNSRSSAVGPYQFIASTWLMLARSHFSAETANLNAAQILALRTERNFARRAAEAYTQSNAAYLAAQGLKPTFPHLRLAFLVGPGGAARILAAAPETRVSALLGPTVIGANPFMANMTAEALIRRAARDIEADPKTTAGLTPDPQRVAVAFVNSHAVPAIAALLTPPVAREAAGLLRNLSQRMVTMAVAREQTAAAAKPARPKIEVNCDLSLPSCRKWLALAERKVRNRRRASN